MTKSKTHEVASEIFQVLLYQYSWDAPAFGTALLWRALRDTDSVRGALGSVLCLGEPQRETTRALLFQNTEGPLTASEHIHIEENGDAPSFKGGFLLLEEIRRSQIITMRDIYPEDFRTPLRSSNFGVPYAGMWYDCLTGQTMAGQCSGRATWVILTHLITLSIVDSLLLPLVGHTLLSTT
ncbi:unnamed protein product [Penicillium viridicatum]